MKVRVLTTSDIAELKAISDRSGFPYPDLKRANIETVFGVVDDQNNIVDAVAVERIVQVYFYKGEAHPATHLHAMRMLHAELGAELKRRGYTEANAFIPPSCERAFGKRLVKTFGAVRNWVSYCFQLQGD